MKYHHYHTSTFWLQDFHAPGATQISGTDPNMSIDVRIYLKKDTYYQVIQDEQDPFLLYFLINFDSLYPDSNYKGGNYIGKIVLPYIYPRNSGNFYMLTPNGRFAVGVKFCLDDYFHHMKPFTPLWSIEQMIIGFISIFLSDDHLTNQAADYCSYHCGSDSTTGTLDIKQALVKDRKNKAINSPFAP